MDIGTAIRTLRLKKSMTQKNFANMVGITQTYLSQIEKGRKKPSLDVLESMSGYLGLPLSLMFWFGVEESDINEEKRDAYRILKPSIDSLISSII